MCARIPADQQIVVLFKNLGSTKKIPVRGWWLPNKSDGCGNFLGNASSLGKIT